MLQVIDHLLLSPRESRHLHKPPAFSPILAKIWRKRKSVVSRDEHAAYPDSGGVFPRFGGDSPMHRNRNGN
jgi:hypothetical protein